MAELWIPGPLPGMNELIEARMVRGPHRNGWNRYSDLKKAWQERIGLLALNFPKLTGPCHFWYDVREPNKRRDPSNFIAGAVKIIEDALVKAGKIEGDGWKVVHGIYTKWSLSDERPGVLVTVLEAKNESVPGPTGPQDHL